MSASKRPRFSGLDYAPIALAFVVACSSANADGPAVSPEGGAPAEDGGILDDGGGPSSEASPNDGGSGIVPSSKGTGGFACARRDALSGGREACVVKVGSVELKVLEPKAGSAAKPLRLGIYLHGDGAGAHKSGSALKGMIAWSDANAGLGVSALAPNGCAWWQTPAHDCAASQSDPDDGAENTPALVAALEAITKAYDVRLDGLRYYTSSGGSIFLTDQWLPLQGAKYPGVHAIMCGGIATPRKFAWNPGDVAERAKHRLFFTYGDQDFLKTDIEESINAFESAKFSVTKKVIPGAEHCAFDAHGEAVGIWSANP